MEEISKLLLKQRIRNRIIEVLKITASYEAQEKFGGNEVINMWAEWVDDARIGGYTEPVFSNSEQECLVEYHKIWSYVTDHTPHALPSVSELKGNQYWSSLVATASKALTVFNRRGRLSEEKEIS